MLSRRTFRSKRVCLMVSACLLLWLVYKRDFYINTISQRSVRDTLQNLPSHGEKDSDILYHPRPKHPGNRLSEQIDHLDLMTVKTAMLLSGLKLLVDRSNSITQQRNSSKPKLKKKYRCTEYEIEGHQQKAIVANVWENLTKYDVDDVAIVTQMTTDKIAAVERILSNWPGTISLAFYVDIKKMPDVIWNISKSERLLKRRNIDLHFVAKRGRLYPANLLRNVALNHTRATYVQMLDADFLPSVNLYSVLRRELPRTDTNHETLVVPAFEFPTKDDVTTFPARKEDLVRLWDAKAIMPFHWKFKPGHGATNYRRWKQATTSYLAVYNQAYEPYVALRRDKTPSFDQHFVGFGGNKISHIMNIYAAGFDFRILPDVFIIHYPHSKPGAPELACSFKLIKQHAVRLRAQYPNRPVYV